MLAALTLTETTELAVPFSCPLAGVIVSQDAEDEVFQVMGVPAQLVVAFKLNV